MMKTILLRGNNFCYELNKCNRDFIVIVKIVKIVIIVITVIIVTGLPSSG